MNWIKTSERLPPKDKSVLLVTTYGLIYCGKERYGNLGEPSQDVYAYRCDSSGRFANVRSRGNEH